MKTKPLIFPDPATYECLRLAYSAIATGDVDYCSSRHLEAIDASLDWVIRVLSPRMVA